MDDECAGEDVCEFCRELIGAQFPIQKTLARHGITDRVVARSERCAAFAGLGPLSMGYVLISPIAHAKCLADLDAETLGDVDRLRQLALSALRQEYGTVTYFEHGSRRENRSGACYDHAHLHLVGGNLDLRPACRALGEEIRVGDLRALPAVVRAIPDYLLVGSSPGDLYVYRLIEDVPSQYLRQQWALAIGEAASHDWAVVPNYALMLETIRYYRRVLAD